MTRATPELQRSSRRRPAAGRAVAAAAVLLAGIAAAGGAQQAPADPQDDGAAPGPAPMEAVSPPWVDSPEAELLGVGGVLGGSLVLHGLPEQRPLAERLATVALQARPLPALPADVLRGDSVTVFLAADGQRLHDLTGGRIPEWGAGVAFPDWRVVVLPAFSSRRGGTQALPRTLRHELAHVALHRYLAGARIPRWFDEGYARWAAGEWDAEAAWKLRLAFALNRAPPLDSIHLDWPAAAADAELAYLLSASAVGFLVDRGGERGVRRLLERWHAGGTLDTSLRDTYGLTLSQFETAWQRDVRSRYGWAAFLSHSVVFWMFAAALLLVLFGIRRRRDRAKLARLRATEPPDDPAYWIVDDGTTASSTPPAPPEGEHPAGSPGRTWTWSG